MHIHIIIHHGPDEEDRLNLLIFNEDGISAVDVVGHAKSESPKHDTRFTLIILLLTLPSAKTLLLYHSRVFPGICFHFLVFAIHLSLSFPP